MGWTYLVSRGIEEAVRRSGLGVCSIVELPAPPVMLSAETFSILNSAVEAIGRQLQASRQEVYDADLQGYFDAIPHDQILEVRLDAPCGPLDRLLGQSELIPMNHDRTLQAWYV
jgi:hypothetical protein